jgi:hypothetical protein
MFTSSRYILRVPLLTKRKSGGVVAAQGQTECAGGGFGTATVRWTIKHS